MILIGHRDDDVFNTQSSVLSGVGCDVLMQDSSATSVSSTSVTQEKGTQKTTSRSTSKVIDVFYCIHKVDIVGDVVALWVEQQTSS